MKENNEIVYAPNSRLEMSWFRTWVTMARNTWSARELIWQLFRRDFLMQYKRSFFGMGWLIISPIVGIASWVIMNSTGILQPGDVGIDSYAAYVLLSSSIWGLFIGYKDSAANTLGAGAGFITQVSYPHEALLAKQILQHTTNFGITFLVNIVVLLFVGVVPSVFIFIMPIIILPLMLLGAAMGLVMSLVSAVIPDANNIFNMFMSLVFYITPIVYSETVSSNFLQTVMRYNPLTYLLGGVRDLILKGTLENPGPFFALSFVSLILFLIALRLFYVSEEKIVEKMI